MACVRLVGALGGLALAAACSGVAPTIPEPVPTPPGISSLRISGVKAELFPGHSAPMWAEVVLTSGTVKRCLAAWSVDDERVATVSPTGLLTARSKGIVNVTAACAGLSAHAETRVVYEFVLLPYDTELPDLPGFLLAQMEFLDGPNAGQQILTGFRHTQVIGGPWDPVRVRFTSDTHEPAETVLSESSGQRYGSKFLFYVPMKFVAGPQTDTFIRRMSRETMEISHPFTMSQSGPVQVRTWWAVDYNDGLSVALWCNGVQLKQVSQVFGSTGEGITQDAPAGECEVRLRQSKSDAATHYRVAIKYPR